ncbi:MAG: VWA domain-containing protein [Gemmataceae bacterium]|nr:VWA domain-containing protein [Gemmataceae bacterium]
MPEFTGRRLPIYLVLDCSGSMSGEPIEAVRQGVKALLADLRGDPQALETAFLSVITFDSGARQVSPLTELMAFQEPNLEASGSTALGEALKLLELAVDKEVKKSTATQKGDWKPLVFLMTDGQPTDNWQAPADAVKARKLGNVIACAAGPGADAGPLKKITEVVVKLDDLQPDTLKQFFRWVSDSIKTTSASVAQVAADGPIDLPPPPAKITIVP